MTSKTVLVTGAASGIGRACARDLLAGGHRVAAFDLSRDALAAALPSGDDGLVLCPGDVSREADCEAAVARTVVRFGRLDALIHFAAIHSVLPWRDVSAAEFNRVLEINVTGAFLISRAAASHMAANGGGAIVLTSSSSINVGSAGGNGRGGPAYVSSKGAIVALTRSLARSLAPDGIRVNAVSPGNADTPMIADYSDAARQAARERAVLGRIAEPGEIAAVARFLISDDASFVTGEVVNANGGASFA